MEKPNIKLNDLSPVLNLLIEKIQLLDSGISSKQQKLACTKDMLEVVDSLRDFFVKATDSLHFEHNKIFFEKIERAFSQFEWNTSVAVSPSDFRKFSENAKLLISSLLKLLGSKGLGLLIIETYIKLCLKTVNQMGEKVDKNSSLDKANFKLLLDGFSQTANTLQKYWHIAFSLNQKNTIMLCLYQICNVLPYLLKIIELQNLDLKKYLLSLLTRCLIKIQHEIHNDGNSSSKCQGQNFIMMMDFCLYKLNELSSATNDLLSFTERATIAVAVLKPIIDEILCSVMSIAQVTTFEEDYYAILSSSQKVLRELSELNKEIKEENGCAIRLNASSVGESLCNLELQVNNAVLKLVLEVFSGVNSPLKNILNRCKMDIMKDNKASEDLNALITEFDLEMDRIMQIGFFTISCTTSLNRILGIQSCLASLESLETELILSLTALYVDCNSKNKTNFQCLFDFWLNEITKLKILIDSVIDPAGFCGVVKNQIKNLRLAFEEDTSNSSLNLLNCNLKKAIRYSKKLIKTLRTNMEDEKDNNKTTDEYLMKFQLAVQECEAVVDLMKEGQDPKKTINMAVKRYDFLMYTLEKLSSHLFLLVTNVEDNYNEKESFPEESNFSNARIPQKNYYKLCESADMTITTTKAVPEVLTPYIDKGVLRSKKRNLLYTTPIQVDNDEVDLSKTLPQTRYWDKSSSSRRSRYCKTLTPNLELENTVDLEMATIFENISKVSDSFFRTFRDSNQGNSEGISKKDQSCGKDVASTTENCTDGLKPTYTSTGCCTKFHLEETEKEEFEYEKSFLGSQLRNRFLQTLKDLSLNDSLLMVSDREVSGFVDSPDIINDLKVVEEKINFLRARMPHEHS